jgi:CubicO group peptidase (beta-lactamase class C family)
MRASNSRRAQLLLALFCPSGLLFGASGSPAGAPLSRPGAESPRGPLAARIERVENGLLLPVAIKGQPLVPMKLAERMKHHKTPGLSVAVLHGGEVEWARGYGVRAAGGPEPVDPETLFQAGSISKAVSAVAALRLVELRKLSLDEDVNERLVAWKVPASELTKERRVTLRRLLSHSAGLSVHGFPGYAAGERIPTLVQVLDGIKPANTKPVRVETTPGAQFRYSGGGFSVLQQLLVDVVGKPFPAILKELVLDPLGMKHSTFEQPLPRPLRPRAAAGHHADGLRIQGDWHVYPEMAAAGLWSTPSDLARLGREVQRAQAEKSNRLLSARMAIQMLSPQIAEDQGLGWELAGSAPAARFYHSGDTAGFKCKLIVYRESGDGAVVMTNGDGGEELAEEILRSIAREYGWPAYGPKERTIAQVDSARRSTYAGRYSLVVAPDVVIVISVEGGRLFVEVLQPSGRQKDELLPASETVFFARESDFELTFVADEAGNVVQLLIRQKGEEYRANKVP